MLFNVHTRQLISVVFSLSLICTHLVVHGHLVSHNEDKIKRVVIQISKYKRLCNSWIIWHRICTLYNRQCGINHINMFNHGNLQKYKEKELQRLSMNAHKFCLTNNTHTFYLHIYVKFEGQFEMAMHYSYKETNTFVQLQAH